MKIIFAKIFIVFSFFILVGCDNGTTSVNTLIGYWRSESTYFSSFSGEELYHVLVFESNRFFEFGIQPIFLDLVKNIPIDNDHWRYYIFSSNKFSVAFISDENVTVNIDFPFTIINNKLTVTYPQSFADSIGFNNRIVTFLRIP